MELKLYHITALFICLVVVTLSDVITMYGMYCDNVSGLRMLRRKDAGVMRSYKFVQDHYQ